MPARIRKTTQWFIELKKPTTLDELTSAIHQVNSAILGHGHDPASVHIGVDSGASYAEITVMLQEVLE